MADLVITSANVQLISGVVVDSITDIVDITAGMAVIVATSGNTIAPGTASTDEIEVVGVALHDSLAGQPIRYQTSGVITLGTGTEGVVYVLSASVGPQGKIGIIGDVNPSEAMIVLGVGNGSSGIDLHIFPTDAEVQ